ncbi:MAG: hypothetical protein K2X82_09010 [Gemmataceae bacterium]|nr:hypothetical protein [Gemmataceae bacterium]
MPRLLAVLVVPAAVLAAAPAAPVPKDRLLAADSYYPTVVGTKLVYDIGGGEETRVVTAVERVEGGTLVTTEHLQPDGTKTPHMKVRVTAKGLFLAEEVGGAYDPPWCILELPPKAGSKWDTISGGRAQVTGSMTAHGVEEVEVPAGTFRAARVDWELSPNNVVSYWYAPKAGLVKMTTGGAPVVLKSFTTGKP